MPSRRIFIATVSSGIVGSLAGCAGGTADTEAAGFGDVGQSQSDSTAVEGPTHRAELFKGYHHLEESRTAYSAYLDGTTFPLPPALDAVPGESVKTAIEMASARFDTAIKATPGDPSPRHRQAPRLATYHRELYRLTHELTRLQRRARAVRSVLTLDGSHPPADCEDSFAAVFTQISEIPFTARLTALSRQYERLSFDSIEMPTVWERTSPTSLVHTSTLDIEYLRTRLRHDRALTRGIRAYHLGRTQYANQQYATAQTQFEQALSHLTSITGEYETLSSVNPVSWITSDLVSRQTALTTYSRASEDMFRALVAVSTGDNSTTSSATPHTAVTRADERIESLKN